MSEQPNSEVKSLEARTPMDPRAKKMIVIVIIAFAVIVLALGVAGYFLSLSPEATTFLRDVAIIVLAFETLLVIFFLGVVIVLLIYVILTLERGVKPVINATSEAVHTVRGTTVFVSETVVSPIMKAASILGAAKGAAQAIAGLRPKGRGKQGSD